MRCRANYLHRKSLFLSTVSPMFGALDCLPVCGFSVVFVDVFALPPLHQPGSALQAGGILRRVQARHVFQSQYRFRGSGNSSSTGTRSHRRMAARAFDRLEAEPIASVARRARE